jgi:site-specific recombinase XerD
LINLAETSRDKCIISLLADSGMRLNELTNIKIQDMTPVPKQSKSLVKATRNGERLLLAERQSY